MMSLLLVDFEDRSFVYKISFHNDLRELYTPLDHCENRFRAMRCNLTKRVIYAVLSEQRGVAAWREERATTPIRSHSCVSREKNLSLCERKQNKKKTQIVPLVKKKKKKTKGEG